MPYNPAQYTVDADALLEAIGNSPVFFGRDLSMLAPETTGKVASQHAPIPPKCENRGLNQAGKAAESGQKILCGSAYLVRQVLSAPVHKVDHSEYRRKEFRLKNGLQLAPHPAPCSVKIAFAGPIVQQPQAQNAMVPVVTAQRQMQQLMPAKTPVLGQGVRPTGLDGPNDTRATALPGTPETC
ncbi:hypothetical protein PM8797T_28094 [Gimesia maris DSM 8797]|uniref:Uncharacterized protein n=1 Tax=Gimesia maris TaxID=122 RepID=A0ABX5YP50_9PLAN|nr:hypothetical protein PM8797T_28094 [Gimesia maris DSM 8797]QEG17332.1 hypothetical protein GmarT_32120 [Gimesia maris]